MPVVTGSGSMGGRELLWRHHGQRAVRRGSWKLVVPAEGGSSGAVPQLFDLAADPTEANDLAGSEPTVVETLSRSLAAWEADVSAGVVRLT